MSGKRSKRNIERTDDDSRWACTVAGLMDNMGFENVVVHYPLTGSKSRKKECIATGKFDYSGNCFPYNKRTYPVGSDLEFISVDFLKKISGDRLNNYEKEHITPFLLKKKFKTHLFRSKVNNSKLRYTLDYKEDLIVIKKILFYLKKKKIFGNTNQIIKFLNDNKKIMKLNNKHVTSYYFKKLNQL